MPIIVTHIHPDDEDQIDTIELEYNQMVSDGDLVPTVLSSLCLDYGKGLLIAREDNRIVGAATYRPEESYCDEEELSYLLDGFGRERLVDDQGNPIDEIKPCDLLGFRTLSYDSQLVNLCMIESFRRGAGHMIVRQMQAMEGIDAIFLDPVESAVDFYHNQGFERSGLCIDKPTTPVMIWTRTGEY